MVSLKLETIKEIAEKPERRMKSKLPYDNSLDGRFGMKSEPVNYSICNAVRIADTIINNRIVMQIISDKLFFIVSASEIIESIIEHRYGNTMIEQDQVRCSISQAAICHIPGIYAPIGPRFLVFSCPIRVL